MIVKTSCEDPSTVYLEFPEIRLVFRDGEYAGWYIHDIPSEEGFRERRDSVAEQNHRCPE